MIKSEASAVLPCRPAAALGWWSPQAAGGQPKRSVLLGNDGDFQHSQLCDSQGDTDVSESFVYVILKEIN